MDVYAGTMLDSNLSAICICELWPCHHVLSANKQIIFVKLAPGWQFYKSVKRESQTRCNGLRMFQVKRIIQDSLSKGKSVSSSEWSHNCCYRGGRDTMNCTNEEAFVVFHMVVQIKSEVVWRMKSENLSKINWCRKCDCWLVFENYKNCRALPDQLPEKGSFRRCYMIWQAYWSLYSTIFHVYFHISESTARAHIMIQH